MTKLKLYLILALSTSLVNLFASSSGKSLTDEQIAAGIAFKDAIKAKDEQAIMAVIAKANLSEKDLEGSLRFCAVENFPSLGKYLIDNLNVDPNCFNPKTKDAPLHLAAWKDNVNILNTLADQKNYLAKINQRRNNVNAVIGYEPLVNLVVDYCQDFDINALNQRNKTAMHIALEHKKYNAIIALIKLGAKLNRGVLELSLTNNDIKKAILDQSTDYLNMRIFEIFRDQVYDGAATPLLFYTSEGDEDMVKALIEKKVSIDTQFTRSHRNNGYLKILNMESALMIALTKITEASRSSSSRKADASLIQKYSNIFKILLNAGANPNLTCEYETSWAGLGHMHQTPLTFAVRSQNIEAILCLVSSRRLDINKKNNVGQSALSEAKESYRYSNAVADQRSKEILRQIISLLESNGARDTNPIGIDC